jgi:hypothetical protein
MDELDKKCKTCFYSNLDKGIHPCNHCFQFDRWVDRNIYIRQEAAKPLSEAIKEWVDSDHSEWATDNIHKPKHYTEHPSGIECIQVTEHMGFNLGNAIKYIWRCDLKQDAIEDLKKAKWYIDREIDKRMRSNECVKHNI